jgi:hypothetical protein
MQSAIRRLQLIAAGDDTYNLINHTGLCKTVWRPAAGRFPAGWMIGAPENLFKGN